MPTSPRTLRHGLTAIAVSVSALALGACGSLTSSTNNGSGDGVDKLEIIVPADAGGGWDSTGREMAKDLKDEDLVGSATVTNMPGAGGMSGLAKIAGSSDPNQLMVTGLVMIGAIETNNSQTSLLDTTPIANLTEEAEIVVVPAKSPYKNAKDLLADIKKKGKGVSIAGGSAGGTDHILAGLMMKAGGIASADIPKKLNYIPYSGGGESKAALLGNKVSAGISGVSEYLPEIKNGTMRALAVSGPERVAELPDVPTLKQSGVDVELTNWRGVVAGGGISDKQAKQLGDMVGKMHDSASWKKSLKTNDWADAYAPADEFRSFIGSEVKTTRATLKDIGLVK